MFAESDEIVVIPALVPVRVVIVAEVTVALLSDKLLIVKLPTRATVAEKSVIAAVVAIKLVIVPLPARSTVAETSAQVRLDGLVPTSTTLLAEFSVNNRLSAVLTASSAPPAAFVKFAVTGTAPGVLLRLVKIVVITYSNGASGLTNGNVIRSVCLAGSL